MLKKVAKLISLAFVPALLVFLWLTFVLRDLYCRYVLRSRGPMPVRPDAHSPAPPCSPPRRASIVIPNWNGRDLLEKYLPAVIEACSPSDEIIVVDNASADGSAEFVRQRFPQVRLLEMERNLGFGGGCNAGTRAARHPIVVLLNNDMRVAADFLAPLLQGFTDSDVFAVSSQIFFADPNRRREETGLTAGWFEKGFVRVRHDIDDRVEQRFPAFYAGGGSSAYDREKFLELGGFDPLFEPFYLEDTDLSYGAWRRGWKVLYEPRSRLFHEHRATIGKRFPAAAIRAYLQKNYVLMVWKNIHRWRWLAAHLVYLYGHLALNTFGLPTETRTTFGAFLMALRQLPLAIRSRRDALLHARVDDLELFRRARPSVFHDTFACGLPHSLDDDRSTAQQSLPFSPARNRRLNILFVSPYSILPALHGGAVFMLQAIREIARRHNLYILTFVDTPEEVESNRTLEGLARKVEIVVRKHRPSHPFHLSSNAERTFFDGEFAALLDKLVYLHNIDLVQFEYTQLAQYRLPLRAVPQCLFEHDVYFHSVQRQLFAGNGNPWTKAHQFLEWLRAIRYEIYAAQKFDAVFTCHEQERKVLESFLGNRRTRVFSGLRTAVDVSSYRFPGGPRAPDSLLFVGNFQHRPNTQGLAYFCESVLPLIRARRPQITLSIVGAGATGEWARRFTGNGIRLLGQVPDIRQPLDSHAVFVCPILTGAGVRVKILEAFASGVPVVSTPLGAEGLAAKHGEHLLLANAPEEFSQACLNLLEQPQLAQSIAGSARQLVETRYDWPIVITELERVYQELVSERRGPLSFPSAPAVSESAPSVISR